MSLLLPDGVHDVKDMPQQFFEALRGALMVLSFDELPSEERPPRRMWRDAEQLGRWFEAVDSKRKSEFSDTPIEDPVSNPAASALIAE